MHGRTATRSTSAIRRGTAPHDDSVAPCGLCQRGSALALFHAFAGTAAVLDPVHDLRGHGRDSRRDRRRGHRYLALFAAEALSVCGRAVAHSVPRAKTIARHLRPDHADGPERALVLAVEIPKNKTANRTNARGRHPVSVGCHARNQQPARVDRSSRRGIAALNPFDAPSAARIVNGLVLRFHRC
jgi:hypothetical protein